MTLFVSYSSQDRSTVDALAATLRRAHQQVWLDQELGGGDSWWAQILEQIRASDVFVVALSSNWLQSKPSQSELRYAQALNRPILPVRIGDIGSMRVNPLAALQIIDYRDPTVDAGIQLVTAIHSLVSKPQPLPDPLPDEPPVPFGYITRLGNQLSEKELSPQQQLQLLVELRSGLDEDGDDPSARSDIAQLLRMMRMRHDVTYRTRNDIDNVLASIEPSDSGSSATIEASMIATQPNTAGPRDGSPDAATLPAAQGRSSTQARSTSATQDSRKRLVIIGGAAAALVAAIVVAIVLVTQSSGKKPAATPRAAHPAPTPPGSAAPGGAPPAAPGSEVPAPTQPTPLDSVLLGAPEVATIMGVPNLDIGNQTQQMAPEWQLSNPNCLNAFYPTQDPAYAGSGFTGVRGQLLHAGADYRVYEAAVSFPTAEAANAFVAASANNWKACAGSTVTVTASAGTAHWNFGNPAGAAPKITLERTRKDGTNQCQRVLSAVSSVVLDVVACAPVVQNRGVEITDQMANNVKQ
ncbi:MAG: sensor domain-containing protein [Actinomycetota bacterium]|uniref:Sensor domain-containing protein n=1 Tax=Mycobacterium lentiflavum TaxID=141349 RepID=A0ABY3UPI0_MYCLN|nr:sensor domain-containing protein [Mycobacterium lentiflavum]MEE3065780.1 sensor domain-containing protein [Actinomycetota bacterium]ULP40596.1 sensor domain-containing protein [Mycobacterium lentiflavum]